jgi:hypothetical protein
MLPSLKDTAGAWLSNHTGTVRLALWRSVTPERRQNELMVVPVMTTITCMITRVVTTTRARCCLCWCVRVADAVGGGDGDAGGLARARQRGARDRGRSTVIAGVHRPAHEALHQCLLRKPHAAHACDKATHRRLVNRSIIIILKVSTTLFPALVGGTLAAWSL